MDVYLPARSTNCVNIATFVADFLDGKMSISFRYEAAYLIPLNQFRIHHESDLEYIYIYMSDVTGLLDENEDYNNVHVVAGCYS